MGEIPRHWSAGDSKLKSWFAPSSMTLEEPHLFEPSPRLPAHGLPNVPSPYFT